jgi:hypothetical protein
MFRSLGLTQSLNRVAFKEFTVAPKSRIRTLDVADCLLSTKLYAAAAIVCFGEISKDNNGEGMQRRHHG